MQTNKINLMKHFFLLLFLSVTLFSCDTLNPCEPDDFVGIYAGTVDCDGTDAEAATYEITKSNNEYFLKDNEGRNLEISITDCGFTIPNQSILLFSIQGGGSLSGNTLDAQIISTNTGDVTTCNFDGEK